MSNIEQNPNPQDRYEMAMFGLDPNNEIDQRLWLETTPSDPDAPVADYSNDAFEFGSVIRTQPED